MSDTTCTCGHEDITHAFTSFRGPLGRCYASLPERPDRPAWQCPCMKYEEAERERLALAIHKAVNSSVQRRTVPFLVGDAERAVTAVIAEGWYLPPGYGNP